MGDPRRSIEKEAETMVDDDFFLFMALILGILVGSLIVISVMPTPYESFCNAHNMENTYIGKQHYCIDENNTIYPIAWVKDKLVFVKEKKELNENE